MTTIANILLAFFLGLMVLNGVRVTFFPANTCNLVRQNQMPTLRESVMEFHREWEDRNAETEE